MTAKENQGAAAPHMQLIIDRAKWLRGAPASSRLRDANGHMCCLGFYGLSCGFTAEDIGTFRTPNAHVRKESGNRTRWPSWLFLAYDVSSPDAAALMHFNDEEQYSEEEREGRISEIFARHGVTVEFVGDAAPAAPKEPR